MATAGAAAAFDYLKTVMQGADFDIKKFNDAWNKAAKDFKEGLSDVEIGKNKFQIYGKKRRCYFKRKPYYLDWG